jgi:hypothetical protein
MIEVIRNARGEQRVVAQFHKEASQTRDGCGANNAPHRAARSDPLGLARGKLFAAQKKLAQDDKQTARLSNKA